jgi:hypothetical protein
VSELYLGQRNSGQSIGIWREVSIKEFDCERMLEMKQVRMAEVGGWQLPRMQGYKLQPRIMRKTIE